MDESIRPIFGITEQQEPKYGVNADGRLFNRASGVAIPDDEPVFIFRAQDPHLRAVLKFYEGLCANPDHRAVVKNRWLDAHLFARQYPERMKTEPDSSLADLARVDLGRSEGGV